MNIKKLLQRFVFFKTFCQNAIIKNVNGSFLNKKLTTKFVFIYIILIATPITILSLYTFSSLEKTAKNQLELKLENSMKAVLLDIELNIEYIDKMSRIATDKASFKQFIIENENINTEDLLFFYNYFIKDMEITKNVNPKIYSSRIFLENEKYLERWPIIYNEERLKNVTWHKYLIENPNQLLWKINFEELIIPTRNDVSKSNNLVGFYNELKYGNIHLGYVETTMEMSVFFKEMYNSINNDEFMMVIDKKNYNKIYFDEQNEFLKKIENTNTFLEKIEKNIQTNDGKFTTNILDEEVFISYQYIKQLDIYVIKGVLSKSTLNSFKAQRNLFIIFALLLVMTLCFLTYKTVYILLKNLDLIIEATRQISAGNLKPNISVNRKDVAGELAKNLNSMLNTIEELMLAALKNQEITKNAEIKALQNQINAHFIHNTLESIRMMAEIDNKIEISDSITSLGKLIRYSMNWKSPLVYLHQEIEYVKNYVKLLNIRHDYNIVLIVKIESYIYNYKILKMTVQPLIENSIRYGIDPFQSDGVIRINGFIENDTTIIEISDTGIGIDEEKLRLINENIIKNKNDNIEKGGIGLTNISERIKFFYGQQYGIEIFSKENCFTKVRMTLPLKNKEEAESLYENNTNS